MAVSLSLATVWRRVYATLPSAMRIAMIAMI
jgi:hypothetical protein